MFYSDLYSQPFWLLYWLKILLLSVGYSKNLNTKLRCGSSLSSLLYTYICICKEDLLWQNWPWCQTKCKAGRVSLEGQPAALWGDLDRKSLLWAAASNYSLQVEALRVRGRQWRFCLISGVDVFISRLQSMVFTTPSCKLGLNMAHFLKIVFNEGDLYTWYW